jgi:ubiquinone/menaquinone biosynthesis C-methylase UbiE
MSSANTYSRFAKFYDMYVSDFAMDLPLYRHFCNRSHTILEVGCGSGRVLKSLAESGCKVLGVDISDEMLAIANNKLHQYLSSGIIRLANFDFSNHWLNENFDRALVTFYTINYLLDETHCENFIGNIQKSMDQNGMLIMDLFYPRPLLKPESPGVWYEKEVQAGDLHVRLRDKRIMIGNIEERIQEYITEDSHETIVSKRRFYTKHDILKILDKSGFTRIEFTDDYDISQFHPYKDLETVTSSFVVKAVKQ